MNTILSAITGAILSIGSFLGIYHAPEPPPQEPSKELGSTTTINLAGTFPYFLAGSGISSSATSIVLTSFTLPQNSYPIQDADLDATFYLTIEPGNRTKQEFVSCTTVGTNTGGTVTLSGCTRGLSPITPYTASSTLKFVHAGGSTVILSNPPQIYEDIYDYINAASFAGSVTATEAAKGISELATAAEQAASTITGGSGPLVLQAQYATSTYNAQTSANKTVVTGTNGRIDFGFIASSTTASSTALSNDGSGGLSWNPYNMSLSRGVTYPLTITGNTGSTTMINALIHPNMLGTSNIIRVHASCDVTLSGGNHRLVTEFAYGTATTTVNVGNVGATSFGQADIDFYISALGATNSQFLHAKYQNVATSSTLSYLGYNNKVSTTTAAVDSTTARRLMIVANPMDSGDEMKCYSATTEVLRQ